MKRIVSLKSDGNLVINITLTCEEVMRAIVAMHAPLTSEWKKPHEDELNLMDEPFDLDDIRDLI